MNRARLNATQEKLALEGDAKTTRRKWRTIVNELGVRKISLKDIDEAKKIPGLLEMVDNIDDMTINDLIILRQVSEAIYGKNPVRNAEFLRDTAGEKPSTQVDLNHTNSPLEGMSTEDLMRKIEELKNIKE